MVWMLESTDAGKLVHSVHEPLAAYEVTAPDFLTVEEYFALEERTSTRHEYVDGAVYAMSGTSRAHNLIVGELACAFKIHLRGGPCQVFSESLKVHLQTGRKQTYYYPDVMVACDRKGWGKDFINNPQLIVEVLSPSTRRIDLQEKAQSYRLLSSVEEYVVASQTEPKITIYRRSADWAGQLYLGSSAVAQFLSIDLSVPLAEIYTPALAT